jgi:serine/threonine-protein kinase
MADVFLAVGRGPSGFNKLVVLKTLRKEFVADVDLRQMFLAEARLSARLNNANVVQIYEVLDTELPCIVMEYLEGQPLSSVLQDAGERFTSSMMLKVLSEALLGLHYSHELKDYDGGPLDIVHRDVSPQNIFITYDGVVKVLDFGIAKESNRTIQTRTGVIKGKLAYMPREQLLNESLDRRADIYAVGCMLWYAAAGAKLWSDMSDGDIICALIEGSIPKPSQVRPVDPALEQIVMHALAPNPQDRYPTAWALRVAIDEYLAESSPKTNVREVGELMSEVFSDQNEARKREIQAALQRPDSELPTASEDTEALLQTALTSIERTPTPQKRTWSFRSAGILSIAALVAVGGVVGAFYLRPARLQPAPTLPTSLPSSDPNRVRATPDVAGSSIPAIAASSSGIEPDPVLPVLSCGGKSCSDQAMIVDMEANNGQICNTDGRGGDVVIFGDGTGVQWPPAGVALTQFSPLSTCRGISAVAMHTKGINFSSWGAGAGFNFSSTGWDASAYTGITFWAMSSTRTQVTIGVASSETQDVAYGGKCVPKGGKQCNDYFKTKRTLTATWQAYPVSFAELRQEGWGVVAPTPTINVKKLMEVQFVVAQGQPFDVWIDDVTFALIPGMSRL